MAILLNLFFKNVAVRISLNLISCIYPPLVINVTHLSLDIDTQPMVINCQGVTMTVVLQILPFVFYQSFDLFVIFIEPVLVMFRFEPIVYLQAPSTHFDICPGFFYGRSIVMFRG